MKTIKQLLFTFDYELFLGTRSGSVDNCMITPTNELQKLFDKYQIRGAIFFVDTTYLMRLAAQENESCNNDFKKVATQLQTLAEKGHYIFPHIHPHWADAVYNINTNQWSLANYSRYRFHNLEKQERKNIFTGSIAVLQEILQGRGRPITGYRAGGWSLQPFSDFKDLFEMTGIKHEFSVVPAFRNLSPAQYFDFSNCPEKKIYRFSEDPCAEDVNGNFTEYTISTLPVSSFGYWQNKFWLKYLWKTGQRSMGDGAGLVIKEESVVKSREEMLGSANREMACIESLNKVSAGVYRKFLDTHNYMHFISHPKMLSLHNLQTFDNFLRRASKKYILETDFTNFQIN